MASKPYHHPDILEKLADVKRWVSLAEMLFKWADLYEPLGSPLDIWSALTQRDVASAGAVLKLAPSVRVFGSIMTELAEATRTCFCHGVQVAKSRGHSGRQYTVAFDPSLPRPAFANGSSVVTTPLFEQLRRNAARRAAGR